MDEKYITWPLTVKPPIYVILSNFDLGLQKNVTLDPSYGRWGKLHTKRETFGELSLQVRAPCYQG